MAKTAESVLDVMRGWLGFSEANIITVYILGVQIVAIVTRGQGCSLIASLAAVLTFNFVFTEPRFTLAAYDEGYPVTFVIMFAAGLLTSSLAGKIKRHAAQSAQTAYRMKVLLETSQQLQQQIAAIPTQPVAKRVLFILSHGGMNTLVAGQHTAADGAIRAAGLQNAMQGFDHYRAMSQEGVAASQADLVVISADGLKGMGGEAGLWKLPGLAQTPAGRHKQLLTIDDMALLGFGPRTPQAIIALRNKAEQLP